MFVRVHAYTTTHPVGIPCLSDLGDIDHRDQKLQCSWVELQIAKHDIHSVTARKA